MISFLDENKISSYLITKLCDYLKEEEFETDSIYIDIEDGIGNIAIGMRDKSWNCSFCFCQNNIISYYCQYCKHYRTINISSKSNHEAVMLFIKQFATINKSMLNS